MHFFRVSCPNQPTCFSMLYFSPCLLALAPILFFFFPARVLHVGCRLRGKTSDELSHRGPTGWMRWLTASRAGNPHLQAFTEHAGTDEWALGAEKDRPLRPFQASDGREEVGLPREPCVEDRLDFWLSLFIQPSSRTLPGRGVGSLSGSWPHIRSHYSPHSSTR